MNRITRRLPAGLTLALALATHLQASARAPLSIDERKAELTAVSKQIKDRKAAVGPLANAVIPRIPEFSGHLKALHAVPLSEAEREVLLAQGSAGLVPAKGGVFAAAAPAFADMKGALAAYFAAYDEYQRAELKLRAFGSTLGALERKAALEPLLEPKDAAKLGPAFAELETKEAAYRALAADPAAKHYKLFQALRDVAYAADDLDDVLLALERKTGIEPKLPWGHKIGRFFKGLKHKAKVAKIQALALPATARLATHVFLRPFWNKTHDADKTNDLIRFYSKSYRWAAGMKLRVKGQEGIPTDAPIVFALSHRATIEDAMTMTAVIPGTYSFMWAASAMPKWLKKRLVADPTVIAVGGKKPDGSKVDAVTEGIKALEEGRNLALFPEGNVPSPQKETRPLRAGLDVITRELSAKPIYIVPITIDDPAAGWDAPGRRLSEHRKLNIDVTVGAAIDPLRVRAVPGADRQLLLDVVRGIYHRNLYRPDVSLAAPVCETVCAVEDLGRIPAREEGKFDALHGR